MLKPLHKIYLLLFVIALIFAGLASLAIYHYVTPYELTTEGGVQIKKQDYHRFYFQDLDHNGVEELLVFGNNPKKQKYYVKVYEDFQGGLIDQFNLNTSIISDGYSHAYYDLNKDGVDEIFVFTNDNDSLYLSVIDIQQVKFLVKEKPIISASPQRARRNWDISYMGPKFNDLDNDGKVELIFNINFGYSRLPRCLCVLNP